MLRFFITLFLLSNLSSALADVRDELSPSDPLLIAMVGDSNFFKTESKFLIPDASKFAKSGVIYDVQIISQNEAGYVIRALIHERMQDRFFFRTLEILKTTQGFDTKILKDVNLSDIEFKITVYLKERLLVLRSDSYDITIIYPVGVGAIDEGYEKNKEGELKSLTPNWKGAAVERKWLEFSRTVPSHFQGKPFIRLTDPNGNFTPIGFHIKQTKTLERSFQSRGCVRMRENDLYELAAIVKYGKLTRIPLNLTYEDYSIKYPILRNDSYYYRPRNFGTKNKPKFKRDSHNLLIIEKIERPAPLNKLPTNERDKT